MKLLQLSCSIDIGLAAWQTLMHLRPAETPPFPYICYEILCLTCQAGGSVYRRIAVGEQAVRDANSARFTGAAEARFQGLRQRLLADAALACEQLIGGASVRLTQVRTPLPIMLQHFDSSIYSLTVSLKPTIIPSDIPS